MWGQNSNPTLDTYSNISTITATGSISLPQTNLLVGSITNFPTSGTISVLTTTNGWQNVSYTGVTTTGGAQFTGCSGGTGSLVNGLPIASGSNTVGLDSVTAWIVLSGPQTQRISLSTAPSGTPIRGETITQSGGVEGEYMGHVWDSVGGTGWMAILPHTVPNGATPTAPTFSNTSTITGSTSGATFSPTGTIITYNREVMIYKDTSNISGTIYYGCFDASGESAQLFSALATQTGCNPTVGPGQGGTNNAFPSRGIVCRGTANSTSTATMVGAGNSFTNNSQMAAVNCVPGTGQSADGTFWLIMPNTNPVNTTYGFAFFRLDDTEPGDCDPYVFLATQTTSYTTLTQTTTQSTNGQTYYTGAIRSSDPSFFGYQSRGNGTLDVFNAYTGMPQSDIYGNTYAINTTLNQMRIVNSPATARPLVMEPLAIYSGGLPLVPNSKPQYKGRCRWLFLSSVGAVYDTFASKTLLNAVAWVSSSPSVVLGPYDGVTTPTQ